MAREITAIFASFLKPRGSGNVKLAPSVCPPLPSPHSGGTVLQLSQPQPTHPSLVTSEPSLSPFFFPLGSGWASQLALACTGGGRGLLRHPLLSCRLAHFRTHSQFTMSLAAISQAGGSARLRFCGVRNHWKQHCIFSLSPSPFFPELPLVLTP